jgi:alginate O-acetyltransferase complex protein AlgI
MFFNSYEFLIFAPVVLLTAALLRGMALRLWLVAASYVFYGWAEPVYCLLLLASTVLDFNVAQRIDQCNDARRRKVYLCLSIIGNIGMLASFKYLGFFTQTINGLAGMADLPLELADPKISLPAGISFYTFQTLAYTIDVYRGKMKATKSFSTMALYVAFFPQLVAGPIERADRLMPQIASRQSRTSDDVMSGISRIAWGLLKKVVFADWLALYVNHVYARPGGATQWDLMLATYAFAFQIYLDFSAYSDIAIGLARTMGIKLQENFRWPYLSRNISEFWRRWHISLSTWLRDYLYIPLGGSRRGARRTLINIAIVMFLGGLWHGADWKFVYWGLWHGLGLIVFHLWSKITRRKADEDAPFKPRDVVGIALTFHFVLISWVLFRADSATSAVQIFGKLFSKWPEMSFHWPMGDVARPALFLAVAMAAHIVRGLGWTDRLTRVRSPFWVGVFWGLVVVLIAIFAAPIRARFIYFQF